MLYVEKILIEVSAGNIIRDDISIEPIIFIPITIASAERIAKFIFDKVKEDLSNSGWNKHSEYLYAVDVFETPTSRARYYQNWYF